MAAEPQLPAPPALEPPSVPGRRVMLAGAGLLLCLAAALALLTLQFRLATHDVSAPVARGFPAPRLETSIDPRLRPASRPGPRPPSPVAPDTAAQMRVETAMAAIVGKGPHAYDPLLPEADPGPGKRP